jgi:hypothetical protein
MQHRDRGEDAPLARRLSRIFLTSHRQMMEKLIVGDGLHKEVSPVGRNQQSRFAFDLSFKVGKFE